MFWKARVIIYVYDGKKGCREMGDFRQADEYHVKNNLGAMEKLFAGYVNARLDSYLKMLEIS